MAESRRLRTEDERAAERWRHTAGTRPGYATYPQTPAGSPSWWQRGQEVVSTAMIPPPLSAPPPPPPPPVVDGETCARWCGFCHLGNGEPTVEQPPAAGTPEAAPWRTDTAPNLPEGTRYAVAGDFGQLAQPRRRWWHRYTRRNRA